MGLILTADGGSTKVHWQLRRPDGALELEFTTTGVNPSVMDCTKVERLVAAPLRGHIDRYAGAISEVRYFGAGCKGREACAAMERAIRSGAGTEVAVTIGSDMLGACVGLLGDSPGIACILGTGANSCLFDGREIIANTPPMGFILGDEGSGTWLGKRILSDRFKGLMPRSLASGFDSAFTLTEAEAIRRVYRPAEADAAPNRFLASLVPFIAANIAHPYMEAIVREGIEAFIRRNVMQYLAPELTARCGVTDSRQLPVSFTGGVAYAFRSQVAAVLEAFRLTAGKITRSPLG